MFKSLFDVAMLCVAISSSVMVIIAIQVVKEESKGLTSHQRAVWYWLTLCLLITTISFWRNIGQ